MSALRLQDRCIVEGSSRKGLHDGYCGNTSERNTARTADDITALRENGRSWSITCQKIFRPWLRSTRYHLGMYLTNDLKLRFQSQRTRALETRIQSSSDTIWPPAWTVLVSLLIREIFEFVCVYMMCLRVFLFERHCEVLSFLLIKSPRMLWFATVEGQQCVISCVGDILAVC